MASDWNGWTELAEYQESGISNIVAINADAFIAASHGTYGGIQKYDTGTNEWTLFIEYPKDLIVREPSIAFDAKTNKIYLYHSDEKSTLTVIDINTHEFTIIDVDYSAGSIPTAMVIDSKLHLVGGASTNKHAIYNQETKTFDKIYPVWQQSTCRHSLIYVSSGKYIEDTLYTFGGIHNLYRSGEIWAHKLGTTKWEKLGIKMPIRMNSFGTVITRDQKYIILLGGVAMEWMSIIYVFNLDKMYFYTSQAKCPKDGVYRAVIMTSYSKDQIIVFGYIRNIIMIPDELINIILGFYETEYVHLINKYSDTNHWKINVDDILQHLTLCF